MDTVGIIIEFICGLGLFLYGMHIMGLGLQKATGSKMKKVLGILTKNKFLGVLLGAGVTAIIQSSSATTVMVVGFVNAGIMNLYQAVGIIMGANIGTTMTSWIVSMGEWAKFLQPTTLAPIAIGVGVYMILFTKKDLVKQIGEIIIGFGILFLGISTMSSGVSPLKEIPQFGNMFAAFGSNPLLGVAIGALVTAIIQSSSASVGILQSLAMAGIVTWPSAVYIIMGQNIGTCVTALLSSIGATKNAKGAAYIHLIFNILGTVVFLIVAVIFFKFINSAFSFKTIGTTQISLLHTIFNIGCTVLLYPFSNYLVKIAEKLCRLSKEPNADEASVAHLDDRILEAPGIAIEHCATEIVRLGKMSYKNLLLASECVTDRDNDKIEQVLSREKRIDSMQQALTEYMIKICGNDLNEEENNYVTSLFHTVNDMERIGDHCENMIEQVQFLISEGLEFSDEAKDELKQISEITLKSVDSAIRALDEGSTSYALKTMEYEASVDKLEQELRSNHINRLKANQCDSTTSVVFLDLLTNLERASDHALNVAQGVLSRNAKKPISEIKKELK